MKLPNKKRRITLTALEKKAIKLFPENVINNANFEANMGHIMIHVIHYLEAHGLNLADCLSTAIAQVEEKIEADPDRVNALYNLDIDELELSVRSGNCCNNSNILTVGQLAMKTEKEMLKIKNFGKKSLREVKEKLAQLNLRLGMKFQNIQKIKRFTVYDILECLENTLEAKTPSGWYHTVHSKIGIPKSQFWNLWGETKSNPMVIQSGREFFHINAYAKK